MGPTRYKRAPEVDVGMLDVQHDGRVARIRLDRPERGNALTFALGRELAAAVERADLDPSIHVIALSGNGAGFCAGYDLVDYAEGRSEADPDVPVGSPIDPRRTLANHDPDAVWDPVVDFQMMRRNADHFMSLFRCDKPVVCKVHGYCVAGGTDLALCSDLLVIEDAAKIGYPPARVWGVPTTALWAHRIGVQRAKRLLLTGDCLTGVQAVEWGLAIEHAPLAELDARFEALVQRIARLPISQLVLHKRLLNQTVHDQGLHGAQTLGVLFDGIARHTPEGHAFARRAAEAGFKTAVAERDGPFGDVGRRPSIGGDPSAEAFWDERYASDAYVFGTEPASFLLEHAARLAPGSRVLLPADGEGRNSAYLAGLGHQVLATDLSDRGLDKARRLARERGVSVEHVRADVLAWDWPEAAFDAVVAVCVQFAPPADRARMFAGMKRAVKPGGLLLLHGYTVDQLRFGTGGPQDPERLYTEDLLRDAFGDWAIEVLVSYERELAEGPGHTGRSALIDLVARRPSEGV